MKDLKPFLDDMLSMSTGTDGRTLEIHFSRPVTKEDRQAFADAHNAIVRGQLGADRLTGWEGEEKLTIEEAWTILCETPDITSPEEYPDHALITMDQLGSFMERAATTPMTSHTEAAKVEARALADRAGIDVGDDRDMFVDDLAKTLVQFANRAASNPKGCAE